MQVEGSFGLLSLAASSETLPSRHTGGRCSLNWSAIEVHIVATYTQWNLLKLNNWELHVWLILKFLCRVPLLWSSINLKMSAICFPLWVSPFPSPLETWNYMVVFVNSPYPLCSSSYLIITCHIQGVFLSHVESNKFMGKGYFYPTH